MTTVRSDVGVTVAVFAGRDRKRKMLAAWALVVEMLEDEDDSWFEGLDEHGVPKVKLTRRVFPRPDYMLSTWMIMLRQPRLHDHRSRAAKIFRRRFRIPFVFFLELVAMAHEWFTYVEEHICGRQCIQVKLKVLAALQVLGRGNFFDDVCQNSLMSESMIQVVFHKFCKHFAEELYDEHIYLPTGEALTTVMADYHKLGFTGAMGSTDVTHIGWGCCTYSLLRSYTGKEGHPSIAYQVTVDHTGRILAVTEGFPGAQNDKTIIRYDAAVKRIREDPIYCEWPYQLRGEDGAMVDCQGLYTLVDNGYHKWRVTLEPTKWPVNAEETAYSKALESVRKDVECLFGIAKGRFRILKLPALYRTKKSMDNVFFACCILHNMLHAYDGLDHLEADVNWAGADGHHGAWIQPPLTDVNPVGDNTSNEEIEVESSHDDLKRMLITSYTYRKKNNDIVWLSRNP